MGKKDLTAMYRSKGANCAQAVLCTYAEELNITEDAAWKISSGLGGGVGGRQGLCGAVNAMAMVVGGLSGVQISEGAEGKKVPYALAKEACERFIEQNGSEICKVLKNDGNQPRSCADLIFDCIDIIEAMREEGKI